MLVGFSFRAKSGNADALRSVLDNPAGAQRVAKAIGATRNVLFQQGDRFVRIFEFPDGIEPAPFAEVARSDPEIGAFLKRIGALTDPAYDPQQPQTLETFTKGAAMQLVLDVAP